MKPAHILDMMSSRDLSLSHRCSVCGYIVIHYCKMQSLVRVGYEFSAAKAQARAEEIARSQMDDVAADIASCREKPHSLSRLCPGSMENPWSGIAAIEIDSKTRAMTQILGMTDVCPYCGNQEPWQKAGSQSSLKTLQAENFPTVYENSERAVLDTLIELQSVLEEKESMRLDDKKLTVAHEEHTRLLTEKETAAAELKNNTIQLQISKLEAQKEQLEKDHKAAGFVAFKAKKEISAKIDEIKEQIDELQKQDKAKKEELKKTIRMLEFALERSSVLLGSSCAKVEHCWSANAETIRLYLAE